MAEILFLLVTKGKTIKATLMDHVLSTRFSKMEKKSECHQSYNLAGATLYKVALSTTLLKSNMVIYKKRHKEVNNICCSNPTSGSNFFKKPNSMATVVKKASQWDKQKTWKGSEYPEEKQYQVKHGASSGCSTQQRLKKTIYRGVQKHRRLF